MYLLPPRIRLLPEEVANQIAAGEVVERPASVVKELVENALDAGATRITVELAEGGRRLIRVSDNGEGMTAQEAVIALQRHATSKIHSADDLLAVRTLGFRGEALPSIASVARMTLVSRARGTLEGTKLEVAAGDIVSLDPVGAPEGTTISVNDLFYNTPARLKFLKAPRTELSQACDAMVRMALARPGVAIQLLHDGAQVLTSPGGDDMLNAVVALYGVEAGREMLAVEYDRGGVHVRGYVSQPAYTRPTRSAQSFFVNGRPVRSRTLTHALDEAYRGALPAGRFPLVALLLEVDPTLVDVNVHPTKAEVRFLRDWEAHRAIQDAVKAALGLAGARSLESPLVRQTVISQEALARGEWLETVPPPVQRSEVAGGRLQPHGSDPFADRPPTEQLAMPSLLAAVDVVRPVAQLWRSYVLAEGARGLLIVDQHLAHERILFQRLLDEGETRLGVQHLASPVTLEVGRREAVLVAEALPALQALGFGLEAFGGDSFLIRVVPACVAAGEEAGIIREIVDQMAAEPAARRAAIPRERLAAAAACKAAVKKGTRLGLEEMRQLLDDLARSGNPHTCPHGCPIAVELRYQELLKRFKRV